MKVEIGKYVISLLGTIGLTDLKKGSGLSLIVPHAEDRQAIRTAWEQTRVPKFSRSEQPITFATNGRRHWLWLDELKFWD